MQTHDPLASVGQAAGAIQVQASARTLGVHPGEADDLSGKRVIVVEDDFILASDICRSLRQLGASVLGPAPTPFYASHLINRRRVDAAVLDIRLHGTDVFELADRLVESGVPIVFATGYDQDELPIRFRGSPILPKPFEHSELIQIVHTLARGGPKWAPAPSLEPLQDQTESTTTKLARILSGTLRNRSR